MVQVPAKLEDLFTQPINVLMLPPRHEDWTKYAIDVAKSIPTSTVFYGVRSGSTPIYLELLDNMQKRIKNEKSGLPIKSESSASLARPCRTRSRLRLALQNKNVNERIIPFNFSGYSELPFEKDSMDLAITQTPNGTDTMLYLCYGISYQPKGLFSCLKPQSYWVHMTSSDTLQEAAYPFFDLLNIGAPEEFESPLLRKVFGKNGWRLSEESIRYVRNNPTIGELVTGPNRWMLYQKLSEQREPMKNLKN